MGRRVLCLFAALVAACALVGGGAATAGAAANDCQSYAYDCTPNYNGSNASGTWAWTYYGGSYASTPNGYHNCTLYAAWRLAQSGMGSPGRSWGNAVDWASNIGGGNHTPAVGSIAWYGSSRGGGFGHVAYVEQVDGANVYIRADNYSSTRGYTTAGWVSASSVELFLHPHDAPVTNPFGSLDNVSSPAPGQVAVRGWDIDPDNQGYSLETHVYVGGEAGTPGASGTALRADVSRGDVAAVYPAAGPNHGFDAVLGARPGTYPVCVYAINIGSGNNVLLGCRTVTVANGDPFGAYDDLSSPRGGAFHVSGWDIDPSDVTASLDVHVYVGGEAGGSGAIAAVLRADVPRDDVAAAYPGVGAAHGYDAVIDAATGTYPVCLYAINIQGGSNAALGCKTVTVLAASTMTATVTSSVTVGGTVRSTARLTDPATGAPLAARAVALFAGQSSTGPFSQVGGATTSQTGVASVSLTPTATTWYQWRFAGDTTFGPQVGPVRRALVAQAVSVTASTTRVQPGQTVTVSGAVTPAAVGGVVKVERYDGTAWRATTYRGKQVQQRRPDGSTTIGYAVTFAPTTGTYRVTSPATATLAAGSSTGVTITVG